MSDNKLYRYPNPSKIEINEADLMLKLRDFRQALKNRLSWSDFLLLAPAWAILLTSDFEGFWIFSGQHVKGAYFALIFIGSFFVACRVFRSIKDCRLIRIITGRLFRDDHKPEKFVENIKNNSKELKR